MDRLLSAEEVAEILGVSKQWVRNHTRANELAHVQLGGLKKYRSEDVEAYVQSRLNGGSN